MLLATIAIGVVIVALLWDLVLPSLKETIERYKARRAIIPGASYDPGRERRAEQRARQLLKSCVNDEEWAMYRDLGFIRVWGAMARAPRRGRIGDDPRAGAPYAYLV
jgi:acyl-coenzyme A synthetase/AMP-(fatty) acid ligase